MSPPVLGVKKEKKPRAKPIRKSDKANLRFPVGRIHRQFKEKKYDRHIQLKASICVTAALEYLCAELLEISGNACKEFKKKRITRRHLALAISKDEELRKLMANVILPRGHVGKKLKRKNKNLKKNPSTTESNPPLTIN